MPGQSRQSERSPFAENDGTWLWLGKMGERGKPSRWRLAINCSGRFRHGGNQRDITEFLTQRQYHLDESVSRSTDNEAAIDEISAPHGVAA